MKHVLCLSWSSKFLSLLLLMLSCLPATAQVNSGSNGSDGAFNPTGNVTINMADHPDGIYHYTSVNIPSGVQVLFTQNGNNTPVIWLVQGDCVISGTINLNGQSAINGTGGLGGVGAFRGGNGGSNVSAGSGPGGGAQSAVTSNSYGGNGSFGGVGSNTPAYRAPAGAVYGNQYLLPLIGGSGGGGSAGFAGGSPVGWFPGGGGGAGAMLIAASGLIRVNGLIAANGGNTGSFSSSSGNVQGGYGSGGGVRLVASQVLGTGSLSVTGGSYTGGSGRLRIDTPNNQFSGFIEGSYTQGFQPIIIPASGQGVQLGIQSIGGVSVAGSPNGVLANPDVILPAQQTNPMNVVVNCSNLPMNTTITVTVRPANGADIVATGTNSSGTQTASTATIPVTMPRGGGIIFAKCVSGVAGSASVSGDDYGKNIAQTGWTAHGERFAQMEITAGIGGSQQVAYITESGKRYTLPVQ